MKDYDYMKKMFDEDGIEVPASLDADALRSKFIDSADDDSGIKARGDLPGEPGLPGGMKNRPRRPWLKPLAAMAACLLIAFGVVPAAANWITTPSYRYLAQDENGLYTFKSTAQLDKTVKKILSDDRRPTVYYTGGDELAMSTVEDAEVPAGGEIQGEMAANDQSSMAADSQGSTANGQSGAVNGQSGAAKGQSGATGKGGQKKASSHSDTYTQVEDVDEADIVKTDGNYIYHVSPQENQVIITAIDGSKTHRVSAVGEEGDSMINDIYVDSNHLIVVSNGRTKLSGTYSSSDTVETAVVSVYDISSREDPKRVGRYTQTGRVLSSRMVGSRMVLVTSEGFFTYSQGDCIPATSFDDSEAKALDVKDIRCVPSPDSASYTTVGLIDTKKGKLSQKTSKTRSVLGSSDQIYCNTTDLYITASQIQWPRRSLFSALEQEPMPMPIEEQTQITRVNFENGKVDFAATGTVDGRVNDQFSMDASRGNFKIATTSQRDGHDVNNLFVMDENLTEVGSLRNFARDEHIEAVRYIGDLAYVITYEQTDPLFIVDLSRPKTPKITGHVKISGFSTLLVPVDSHHILGFGYSTESTEFGEATNGVKLALFDVSDPYDPKVSDSREFPGTSSPIQYDHKALLVGPEGSYYAFPFSSYDAPQSGGDVIIEDIDGPTAGPGGDAIIEDIDGPDAGSSTDVIIEDIDGPTAGSSTDAIIEDVDESAAESGTEAHGIKMFDARGGKISRIEDLPSGTVINRCIYIGNYVYGICEDDSIRAYKI